MYQMNDNVAWLYFIFFLDRKKKTLCNRAKGDEENAVYIFMELDVKELAEREREGKK